MGNFDTWKSNLIFISFQYYLLLCWLKKKTGVYFPYKWPEFPLCYVSPSIFHGIRGWALKGVILLQMDFLWGQRSSYTWHLAGTPNISFKKTILENPLWYNTSSHSTVGSLWTIQSQVPKTSTPKVSIPITYMFVFSTKVGTSWDQLFLSLLCLQSLH